MTTGRWRTLAAVGGLALMLLATTGVVIALNLRGESPGVPREKGPAATPDQVSRGAYLALAGNCAGCHTLRGGQPYAGGVAIETPFGVVFSSNLTPDPDTGIGHWSAAAFWRALHNGRSRDGRLLYPAFPYPNYTRITREDSDALLAHLQSQAPVRRPNTPHALRFPYDSQPALAIWRALFFKPEATTPRADRDARWNRGSYLVNALGHCNACHSERNRFGATVDETDLGGGLIPMQNWYAPSLTARREASVADWPLEEIVTLLRTGIAPGASVLGPMADVVYQSTQHLALDDLQAIAVYLKDLTPTDDRAGPASPAATAPDPASLAAGRKVYEAQCRHCHGDDGEGRAGVYPRLADNRAVTLASPVNLVHVVIAGGYPPATTGNPRPFGMPPYATVLSDSEIASVLTMIRNSWGNQGTRLVAQDVRRVRDSR